MRRTSTGPMNRPRRPWVAPISRRISSRKSRVEGGTRVGISWGARVANRASSGSSQGSEARTAGESERNSAT